MNHWLQWLLGAIAALLMGSGALYISYGTASRLFPRENLALRWSALCVVGMWASTVAFHLLLAFELFRIPAAMLLTACSVIATRLILGPWGGTLQSLAHDLRLVACCVRIDWSHPWKALLALAAQGALLAIAARGLLVPVLSWDSLTYHAVKAALWVQDGAEISLSAPGGWSIYRSYLGGGESFHAWAMLPLHGDLLAGAVDVVQWLFLGVASLALGHELGLTRPMRWIATSYLLLLPAVARAVGSLYVDTALALLLILAFLMALHAWKRHCPQAALLCMVALGVACGVKVFAAPVALALGGLMIVGWLGTRRRRRHAGWIGIGILLGTMAAAPWFVRNYQLTGYPLSPLPLSVAGVKLGEANDALRWYMDRPQLRDVPFGREVKALGQAFGVPRLVPLGTPALGVLTLLPVALALLTLPLRLRGDPLPGVLLLLFVVPQALSYYGADMANTRLEWAGVSGRYVLAAVGVAIVWSFTVLQSNGPLLRVYAGLLLIGSVVNFVLYDAIDWTAREMRSVGIIVLLLLALPRMIARRTARSRPFRSLLVAWAVAIAAMAGLQLYRDSGYEAALREVTVLHPSQKYWVPAALAVEATGRPQRLAITAGAAQDNDNWFLYPFLGRRLQNRLRYIPVTADGAMLDLSRMQERAARSDFGAWLERLRTERIDRVISFSPTSLELVWMERRPDLFLHESGDRARWGLYRLQPALRNDVPNRGIGGGTR